MAFTPGYKVNEGTQYEFTVSNETIDEIVQGGGITEQDIADYCYTGLIDNRINRLIAADTADPLNFSSAAAIRSWSKEHTPYYFGEAEYVISNTDLNGESDTVYERNFLVWHGTIYPETEDEKTGTFLVMDMTDIKRWYVNYDTNMFYDTVLASTSTREGGTFTGYNGPAYSYNSSAIAGNPEFRCDNNDPLLNPDTNLGVINVLAINDELWIGQLNPSNKGQNEILYAYSVYANYIAPTLRGYIDNTISEMPTYYQKGTVNFAGIPTVVDMNYPEISGENFTFQSYAETTNDYIIDVSGRYGGDWHVTTGGVLCKTLNALKNWMSWCGLKFQYQDTMYKPIISGGIIIGYSDDMDADSEYDDMTNVTGNNISPIPPGPGPGPSGDDPWHGVDFGGTGAGGGGAFCSVYYMTGAQLTSLKNWSNTSAPEGFDMLPSIIGLQQLPISITGIATTVKFLKSAAITSQGESRLVDTGVAAGAGTGQPVSFSLGSVDINRRMQQRGEPYLDYDCTVELFLPFAGTFVLDTQAVMGRTINAEIVIDPVNGTAFAYAWVSQGGQKMPIAYGGGSIAVDLPIASNQWGISRAAFKQASQQMTMNAIKDLGDFMIGLKISKTGQAGAIANRSGYAALDIKEGLQAKQIGGQMMTSSTINAATDTASAIVNAHQLNNTNYTAVRGSFGGSYAEWAQPFTAYVRITRPKFKKPSNFNHTQAVPCVEAKTLSSCSGLTICINPDCGSISCTEAEKIMITQALVGGVYAGGGQ